VRELGLGRLRAFLAAYNRKHGWDAAATDEGVVDSAGAAVTPAYRVRPRVVFGWDADLRADPLVLCRWEDVMSVFSDAELRHLGPRPRRIEACTICSRRPAASCGCWLVDEREDPAVERL
jgi:hypothetical protein